MTISKTAFEARALAAAIREDELEAKIVKKLEAKLAEQSAKIDLLLAAMQQSTIPQPLVTVQKTAEEVEAELYAEFKAQRDGGKPVQSPVQPLAPPTRTLAPPTQPLVPGSFRKLIPPVGVATTTSTGDRGIIRSSDIMPAAICVEPTPNDIIIVALHGRDTVGNVVLNAWKGKLCQSQRNSVGGLHPVWVCRDPVFPDVEPAQMWELRRRAQLASNRVEDAAAISVTTQFKWWLENTEDGKAWALELGQGRWPVSPRTSAPSALAFEPENVGDDIPF